MDEIYFKYLFINRLCSLRKRNLQRDNLEWSGDATGKPEVGARCINAVDREIVPSQFAPNNRVHGNTSHTTRRR